MVHTTALALALLAVSMIAVTTAEYRSRTSHRHKEHPEKGNIEFFYDQHTHYMAAKTSTNCYLMLLSPSQQTIVHTPTGLDMLELSMIRMITGNEARLDEGDLAGDHDHLSSIRHFCHHNQMYDLGILPVTTTARTTAPTTPATTPPTTPAAAPPTTPATTTFPSPLTVELR